MHCQAEVEKMSLGIFLFRKLEDQRKGTDQLCYDLHKKYGMQIGTIEMLVQVRFHGLHRMMTFFLGSE